MANVNDVAAYIIDELGSVAPMKLQKLLYYCQAWHLVCAGEPLFDAEIQAWEHGPVVPDVYRQHGGRRDPLSEWAEGDAERLSAAEAEGVSAVLQQYGTMTASQLRGLTHDEQPWAGAYTGERNVAIDHETMRAFYAEKLDDACDLRAAEHSLRRPHKLVSIDDLGSELGF
jgi:uncharacterized phage-associated protein